jgi:hypothetical protein
MKITLPKFFLLLEALAGVLFGYTMYVYQQADEGASAAAWSSGLVGGLVVFGLSHAMTKQLQPSNRLRLLIALNVTLAGLLLFANPGV